MRNVSHKGTILRGHPYCWNQHNDETNFSSNTTAMTPTKVEHVANNFTKEETDRDGRSVEYGSPHLHNSRLVDRDKNMKEEA